jgi:AraC family transcriptional regulator
VLIADAKECLDDDTFTEEPFVGGLYAVRKVAALSAKTIQDGWNRLLSEWLPKSTFEIGTHQYIEEFIAYNGKVTRMNLYLPVLRKFLIESIEVVELMQVKLSFCRGYGAEAQEVAEKRLIDWYERGFDINWQASQRKYYMSFHYGNKDSEEYWWENGILTAETEAPTLEGLEEKCIGAGSYACCVSKTYGLLTGVLDNMHRWIMTNGIYRLDEERQWFAEYHTFEGLNVERDTIVKVYIPII